MPLPSAEMIEQAHALLSQIERNASGRPPDYILLALILIELRRMREKGEE
jgi:hypothetical protein